MRALEEDEFAVEHQLVYRLDQVHSAIASSSTHDTAASVYTQSVNPTIL